MRSPPRVLLLNPLAELQGKHVHFHRDWCGGELPTSVVYPPLDLATTASYLRERGTQVTLIDASALHMPHRELLLRVARLAPDFVGLPSAWGSLPDDLDLARRIKEAAPRAKVVMSGPNATVHPHKILEDDAVDFIILGELELPFGALVDGDLSANLAYRGDDGEVVVTPRELLTDLDSLPLAARDLLPNARYATLMASKNPFTLMMTSRGCDHRCTFCQAGIFYPGPMRFRSPANTVDEIQHVVQDLHIPYIIFRDLTLTANREHILTICQEIRRRGLQVTWRCFSCTDTIEPDLLRAMKAAGCHQISYGLESGSQRVLDATRKGTTLEQSRRAVRLTKEAGIEACCDFMLGMYGDDRASLHQTVDFALELDPEYAQFQVAVPVHTTPFHDQCHTDGAGGSDGPEDNSPLPHGARWFQLDQEHPVLPTALLNQEIRRAYRRFYLRIPVLARQLGHTVRRRQLGLALSTARGFLGGLLGKG